MKTVQLECFIAVAEHLNFSRASEELKITQPAVSHQIKALEKELGVKLFQRTSKNVALTPEGFAFLPDAGIILKTAASARERLGSRKQQPVPLDIGCCSRLELPLLISSLRNLSRQFPALRPQPHIVPVESFTAMVENRQLHAAFGFSEGSRKTILSYKELFSCPIAFICSPEHPLSDRRTLRSSMLQGSIVTGIPHRIPMEILSIHTQLAATVSYWERYFGDSIETILALVKAGLGYTLYPDIPGLREPELSYIPVTDLPRLSFGIYYRSDNDYQVLRDFLSYMQKQNS